MMPSPALDAEVRYAGDLARGFGGALLFSTPLLMTQEMWSLPAEMAPARLLMFIALALPLLYGLAYYAGFRSSVGVVANTLDTLAAVAVGFILAGVILTLFGIVDGRGSPAEIAGQLGLQSIAGAFGALLARRQLAPSADDGEPDDDADADTYFGELFLMVAGALFIAFNIAPTEEVMLIAHMMSGWMTLALAIVSIALLHVIVYRISLPGQHEHDRPTHAFFAFSVVGYSLAMAVCLYVLWTFGRLDGLPLQESLSLAMVLGFPASIGAAAARLLV
mgnify:CR=1 FL=1